MFGLVLWKSGGGRLELRRQEILRVPFLRAEVAPSRWAPLSRHRSRRALEALSRNGIRQAIFPPGFQPEPGESIAPVTSLPLRQALAADWARLLVWRQGIPGNRARVGVVSRRLTPRALETVEALARRHRYVLLDTDQNPASLCRRLRWERGISVLLRPTETELREADALLLFDPAERLRDHPAAAPVYDETVPLPPLALPPELQAALPPELPLWPCLSALYQYGAIRKEALCFSYEEAQSLSVP